MNLFVIRHAEAVELGGPDAPTDFDRGLTPYGAACATALAERLRGLGIELGAILSSPLVRAVQTSTPLLAICGNRQILNCDELSPEIGKPKKIAARINALNAEVVAVVGHRPSLDDFIAWLIGADKGGVKLAKGAVAKVKFDGAVGEGYGTLAWQIPPAVYYPAPKSEQAATPPPLM